jgi:hypothetical protein
MLDNVSIAAERFLLLASATLTYSWRVLWKEGMRGEATG